ncbi:MAG: MFS transporter [Candidatus Eisenbacteria bacterium]|nr:MFS transporter [Candidatus Eisenbacteria bacterium]
MDGRTVKGRGAFRARRVLTVSAAHAMHDTYTAFLPLFVATLAMSKTEAGLLDVVRQAPWLLMPFVGHMADRFRSHALVILAPAVTGAAMTLLGVAPGFGAMALLLLVVGISSSAFHGVAPALSSAASGSRIGLGMGLWMVGGELGRTIGPIVFPPALALLGPGGLPWLMIGGILGSALLWRWLRGSEAPHLDTIHDPLPWRNAVRRMGPLLAPITAIFFLRSFLVRGLTFYLPTFLREGGDSLWLAGVSLACLEGAGVAGALLGGGISDRIGRRRTLTISLASTPFLLFLFLVAGGPFRFALLLLLGFTSLAVNPILLALVHESFPGNRALANSVYMALSTAVNMIGVFGMGVFSDLWTLGVTFPVSAALALLCIPVVRLLPRRVPGAPDPLAPPESTP